MCSEGLGKCLVPRTSCTIGELIKKGWDAHVWTYKQLRAQCHQFSHDVSLITVGLSSALGAFITCSPGSSRFLRDLPTDQVVAEAHIQQRKRQQ